MSRMHRRVPCAVAVGLLTASCAMAMVKLPSPADSDVPCQINLVGTTGGAADSRGQVTLTIRNFVHNPLAGTLVVIDFSACAPDIHIGSVQPFAGVTADCNTSMGYVRAMTDGSGVATLCIVGGASNVASGAPAAGFRCAAIYADGVNMGTCNIGVFDENGSGGVNPADVSTWLSDSFDGDYEGRSDYNNTCATVTPAIDPADLSLLLGVSLGGGSFQSCGAYCH